MSKVYVLCEQDFKDAGIKNVFTMSGSFPVAFVGFRPAQLMTYTFSSLAEFHNYGQIKDTAAINGAILLPEMTDSYVDSLVGNGLLIPSDDERTLDTNEADSFVFRMYSCSKS